VNLKGPGRSGWLVRRLLQVPITALGVLLIVFILVRVVPGNPAVTILGTHATPEAVRALRAAMHLNVPLPDQLWLYLRDALSGNLGSSLVYNEPVTTLVLPSLGTTALLTTTAVALAVVVGVPLGLLAGFTRRSWLDLSIRGSAIVQLAIPPFLFGFFLLLVVALQMKLATAGGWGTTFVGDLQYVWLPAVALAAYLVPLIIRTLRQSTRQTLEQEFIEATVSRGTGGLRLAARHVLPNSLLPIITVLGMNIGGLLGGAVVIEAVFNLPGIGTTLVMAVDNRDYPVVQGTALIVAVLVILVNLATDLLYFAIDPRLRETR
jgi:peptide/nickel transport system permease protein